MRRLRAPPASLCREGSQAGAGDARGCCGAGKETGFNFLRPLAHASKVPLQAQCCWGKQLYWGLKPRVWLTYDSHTESCSWRCSLQRPLGARLNACRATHPVRPVHRNSHSTPSLHHSLVQRRRSPPPRRIKCMLAAVAGWPLCAAQPQLLYPSVRLSSSKSEPSPRHAPLEADTDGQGLSRISGCLERRPRTHSWLRGGARLAGPRSSQQRGSCGAVAAPPAAPPHGQAAGAPGRPPTGERPSGGGLGGCGDDFRRTLLAVIASARAAGRRRAPRRLCPDWARSGAGDDAVWSKHHDSRGWQAQRHRVLVLDTFVPRSSRSCSASRAFRRDLHGPKVSAAAALRPKGG